MNLDYGVVAVVIESFSLLQLDATIYFLEAVFSQNSLGSEANRREYEHKKSLSSAMIRKSVVLSSAAIKHDIHPE